MEAQLSGYGFWALGIVLALFALASIFLTLKKDAREPPYLSSSIPLIGHLIGITTLGAQHFEQL